MRGNKAVVIAVEKRSVAKLQDQRTVSKISLLDDHVTIAFAGAGVNHFWKLELEIILQGTNNQLIQNA